jgi:hypothetical protein
LQEEGKAMCKVLSAVESHPASSEQRRAIMEQRVRENAAHVAYDQARQALFKRAGWGSWTTVIWALFKQLASSGAS